MVIESTGHAHSVRPSYFRFGGEGKVLLYSRASRSFYQATLGNRCPRSLFIVNSISFRYVFTRGVLHSLLPSTTYAASSSPTLLSIFRHPNQQAWVLVAHSIDCCGLLHRPCLCFTFSYQQIDELLLINVVYITWLVLMIWIRPTSTQEGSIDSSQCMYKAKNILLPSAVHMIPWDVPAQDSPSCCTWGTTLGVMQSTMVLDQHEIHLLGVCKRCLRKRRKFKVVTAAGFIGRAVCRIHPSLIRVYRTMWHPKDIEKKCVCGHHSGVP